MPIPFAARAAAIAAFGLGCIFAGAAALAQQQDTPPLKTVPVKGNIHMLVGNGGNIGVLVGSKGALVIDDQFAPAAPQIRAAVATLTDQPIRFLLNTHWHGDHTGGNAAAGRAGALIVAHTNVRNRMSTEQPNAFSGGSDPASPAIALPVVTYDAAMALHIDDEDVEVSHVRNAHTDGDSLIRFRQSNVVHTGDLFFNRIYPFIDGASGGSYSGTIAAADALLQQIDDDTLIIPGHGPLATKKDLQTYREMLATVRGRIVKLIKAGRTQEQVIAAKPTADFDAEWTGFWKPDVWVGIVYVLLAREVKGGAKS